MCAYLIWSLPPGASHLAYSRGPGVIPTEVETVYVKLKIKNIVLPHDIGKALLRL